MKILIADDSFLIRERLKELLSDILKIEDFIEAENSVETIQLISETIPDIVILDIRMPGGGGLEVLKKINKKSLPIKIIVFTNYPYPQYKKKCFELGADYFFDKATEFEKVKEVICNLINKVNIE